MTVKELKKLLSHANEDLEVHIQVPRLARPGIPDPYMYNVKCAKYVEPWGCGGNDFQLETDDGFEH